MISTKLKNYLKKAGVPFAEHPHRAAYTSQEIAQATHIPGREMLKSVILKTDEGQLIMAVVSADDAVNLDALREKIGCGMLRLASESDFREAFPDCEPGAMPPFGNLFNLPTYCETSLSRNPEIEFSAGTHKATIRMTFMDYEKLVNPQMGHFAQPYQTGLQRLAA